MRTAFLAIAAVCLVAACNQNNAQAPGGASSSSTTASTQTSGGIPVGTTPYRADMTMTVGGHSTPAIMYRSGANSRTEMDTPAGHTIMIMNGDTHTGYSIMNVMGRTVATRMDLSTHSTNVPTDWKPEDVAAATRGGPCTVAGENGTTYTRTTTTPDGGSGSWGACLTSDGIMLQTSVNGSTIMEATHIQRGPQDPSLFQLPPGVTAHDMGDTASAMRDAIAAAQGKHH